VPDILGHTVEEALADIKAAGLEHMLEGRESSEDIAVVYQNPPAGEVLDEKSTVVIYSELPEEKTMVKMPYLADKSIREAKRALQNLGLNIVIDGAGVCTAQQYPAGTLLEKGSIVKVKFRYLDSVH
jgi:serine/threonine-protein kinase